MLKYISPKSLFFPNLKIMSHISNVLSIRWQMGGPRPKYSLISPSGNFRDISTRKYHSFPDMNLIFSRCHTNFILFMTSQEAKISNGRNTQGQLSWSFSKSAQMWTNSVGDEKFRGSSAGVLEMGPFIQGTWEVVVPNFGQSSQCLSSAFASFATRVSKTQKLKEKFKWLFKQI